MNTKRIFLLFLGGLALAACSDTAETPSLDNGLPGDEVGTAVGTESSRNSPAAGSDSVPGDRVASPELNETEKPSQNVPEAQDQRDRRAETEDSAAEEPAVDDQTDEAPSRRDNSEEEQPAEEQPAEEAVSEGPASDEPETEAAEEEEAAQEDQSPEQMEGDSPQPVESGDDSEETNNQGGPTSGDAKLEEEATGVSLFPEELPPHRPRKRMNIDQLDRAIETTTGGIRWKDDPSDEVGLFEELGLSLGKPDFLVQTSEDLEPSALFQKFLGDASRKVCFELLETEKDQIPSQRIFLLHVKGTENIDSDPVAIEANIRYLLERFHSHSIPEGAPSLNPWLWLFESATHVSGDPIVAWRTVCVALIQHPDFYSY